MADTGVSIWQAEQPKPFTTAQSVQCLLSVTLHRIPVDPPRYFLMLISDGMPLVTIIHIPQTIMVSHPPASYQKEGSYIFPVDWKVIKQYYGMAQTALCTSLLSLQ